MFDASDACRRCSNQISVMLKCDHQIGIDRADLGNQSDEQRAKRHRRAGPLIGTIDGVWELGETIGFPIQEQVMHLVAPWCELLGEQS